MATDSIDSDLILSCKNGDVESVKAILDSKLGPNYLLTNENQAFCLASRNGHLEIINILLKIDAVKDNITIHNNYALRFAAKNGHFEVVQRLLDFEDVQKEVASVRNYAMREASLYGHAEVVKYLLSFNDVIENVAIDKNYAFKCAAVNGHLEIVKVLLKYKSVLDEFLDDANKLLSALVSECNQHVFWYLFQIDAVKEKFLLDPIMTLKAAAAIGSITFLQELFERNKINLSSDEDKIGLLCSAARGGYLEVVKWLLNIDEIKYVISSEQLSPTDASSVLCCAASSGVPEILETLLEEKSLIKYVAFNNNKALCEALYNDGCHVYHDPHEDDLFDSRDFHKVIECLLKYSDVVNALVSDSEAVLTTAEDANNAYQLDWFIEYVQSVAANKG